MVSMPVNIGGNICDMGGGAGGDSHCLTIAKNKYLFSMKEYQFTMSTPLPITGAKYLKQISERRNYLGRKSQK